MAQRPSYQTQQRNPDEEKGLFQALKSEGYDPNELSRLSMSGLSLREAKRYLQPKVQEGSTAALQDAASRITAIEKIRGPQPVAPRPMPVTDVNGQRFMETTDPQTGLATRMPKNINTEGGTFREFEESPTAFKGHGPEGTPWTMGRDAIGRPAGFQAGLTPKPEKPPKPESEMEQHSGGLLERKKKGDTVGAWKANSSANNEWTELNYEINKADKAIAELSRAMEAAQNNKVKVSLMEKKKAWETDKAEAENKAKEFADKFTAAEGYDVSKTLRQPDVMGRYFKPPDTTVPPVGDVPAATPAPSPAQALPPVKPGFRRMQTPKGIRDIPEANYQDALDAGATDLQ